MQSFILCLYAWKQIPGRFCMVRYPLPFAQPIISLRRSCDLQRISPLISYFRSHDFILPLSHTTQQSVFRPRLWYRPNQSHRSTSNCIIRRLTAWEFHGRTRDHTDFSGRTQLGTVGEVVSAGLLIKAMSPGARCGIPASPYLHPIVAVDLSWVLRLCSTPKRSRSDATSNRSSGRQC